MHRWALFALVALLVAPPSSLATNVQHGRAERLRLCVTVLIEYEERTMNHWLAYHQLVGVREVWLYIDDRPMAGKDPQRIEEEAKWLQRLERTWGPFVRVLSFTRSRLATQPRAMVHCQCEALRLHDHPNATYGGITWVASIDGDEYLHLGAPVRGARAPTTHGGAHPAWRVSEVLAAVPRHVLGLIMPRRTFVDAYDADTGSPEHPVQPSAAEVGQDFFEPKVYTRAVAYGPRCPGKALLRIGHGMLRQLRLNIHLIWMVEPYEDWTCKVNFRRDLENELHYPTPLTSLEATYMCGYFQRTQQLPAGTVVKQGNKPLPLDYAALQVYHYRMRSRAECELKTFHQSTGVDVQKPRGRGGPGHRAKEGAGVCTVPPNQTVNVFGLSAAAGAVDTRASQALAAGASGRPRAHGNAKPEWD